MDRMVFLLFCFAQDLPSRPALKHVSDKINSILDDLGIKEEEGYMSQKLASAAISTLFNRRERIKLDIEAGRMLVARLEREVREPRLN